MGDIGKRIKIARKYKGLSQDELAKRIGVAQQNIARWEKGERIPGAKNLIKISKALDVSIDWILTGESSFMVKDGKKSKEKEDIIQFVLEDPEMKNLFVFLSHISLNFRKKIDKLIKTGFTYKEALLFLAIKYLKEKE